MKYGYVRDSLNNFNNIEKQKSILEKYELDKIIVEKSNTHIFKRYHRMLRWLIRRLKKGDTVYVVSVDRLTRYEKEYDKIIKKINKKEAGLVIDRW